VCRLNGDENAETQRILQQFNVMEVPTFIFFKQGREVMRHVGSSRGDLIGKILQVNPDTHSVQLAPPPPPLWHRPAQ
jgi:thioredoxin-like negative regulator of GroEL